MRENRELQRPLTSEWLDHRLSDELRQISEILDDNPLARSRVCTSNQNRCKSLAGKRILPRKAEWSPQN